MKVLVGLGPFPAKLGPKTSRDWSGLKMMQNAHKINTGDQVYCPFVTVSVQPFKLESKICTRPLLYNTEFMIP